MTIPRKKSTAICILGMHRSGTSSITRALNLSGVYLGETEKFRITGEDNPKGHWEYPEILDVQQRLLRRLDRQWDTLKPLPAGWHQSEAARPFKEELAGIVATAFADRPVWAWKDPQTCLLLPIWRDILRDLDTELACVFMVRNPVDVASSLAARNSLPLDHGLGLWFHYNIAALEDASGLPTVFLSYERFLESWETELRRCLAGLGLDWPADDRSFRANMESFIDPALRRQQSPPSRVRKQPWPVQELYQLLSAASLRSTVGVAAMDEAVNRLAREFHAYATLLQTEPAPPPSWWGRTSHRWQRSFRKRMPKWFPAPQTVKTVKS